MSKPRMLTGDRPTGKFHLGHYVGTIKNRVKLQHEYESFFLIADLHMLTTKHLPEHIREADAHARELILDAIAAGIEPEHVTFYLQSGVHEISEMYTLFQNLVTVSRLERLPSLKDMARDANIEMPFGLLGYPVLQAADILSVKANVVPVGKDNVAHVEVKQKLALALNVMLDPMRERRAAYDAPGRVEELIYNGTLRVREKTKKTLFEMQKAMGFTGVWNRIRRKAEKSKPPWSDFTRSVFWFQSQATRHGFGWPHPFPALRHPFA